MNNKVIVSLFIVWLGVIVYCFIELINNFTL